MSLVEEFWALGTPIGTVLVAHGEDITVIYRTPQAVVKNVDISYAFSRSQAYSAAVGARVSELIEAYVEEHPDLASTPPEVLAEALVDVAVDPDADRSELADLLAPFWTPQRTAQALGGLTRQAMSDRRKSGSLLGVRTTDGDFFYPVAQFEAHAGGIRVKPDLRTFMMALRKRDPWTVAVLLHTPADELGGRTPLDWVRHGRDPEALVAYARLVNAEFER